MNNTNKLLYRKIILLPLMLIILLLIQSKFVSGFNLNTAVHVNNKSVSVQMLILMNFKIIIKNWNFQNAR